MRKCLWNWTGNYMGIEQNVYQEIGVDNLKFCIESRDADVQIGFRFNLAGLSTV